MAMNIQNNVRLKPFNTLSLNSIAHTMSKLKA